MKTSIVIAFAAAILLSSAGAMVAPSALARPDPAKQQPPVMTAVSPPPATGRAQPHPAPMPGGMVSHSSSPAPVISIGPMRPPPPIVAIPRIPGPADMMVAAGTNPDGSGAVRTLHSYPSNEACAAALAAVRRTISNAFCVSTTPPPPPPEFGLLAEIDSSGELVGLREYPSMKACAAALAAQSLKPGHRAACTDRFH